jgi:hypothetical protein
VSEAGTILQIVPHAPGGRDGVGDYARILAGCLKKSHDFETTFISAAPSASARTEDGYPLLSPLRTVADGRRLEPYGGIVLHYVNYGFNRRGVPVWLPSVLRRLQITVRARLVTVFHELYASGSWRQSAFWLRPIQMRIARLIAETSDVAIVSSEVFREQLTTLAPLKRPIVRPVFSNLGEPALSSAEIANRDPHRWIIFGGTELIERSLRSFLRAAVLIAERYAPRELWVFGGAENSTIRRALQAEKTIRTHYQPDVDAKVASKIMAASAFGWIDYFRRPDDPMPVVLKSGVFATYCAHGVIPVFPHGGSPIKVGHDVLPGPFFVAPNGQELPAETERASAAQEVYSWYGRNAASGPLAAAVAAAIRDQA